MTQKTAQIIFLIFNVLAVAAVSYAIVDLLFVLSSIRENSDVIPFDSATYYLLLMSVFWVMSVIQFMGLRNKQSKILRYANQLAIGWFLLMLLLANVIPYYLVSKLEAAGYEKCDDPTEISRIGRGESSLYMRQGCH